MRFIKYLLPLLLLLIPAAALAHGGAQPVVADIDMKIDGQDYRVGLSDWPPVALKSIEFAVHPWSGSIEGLSGYIDLVPDPSVGYRSKYTQRLTTWPGNTDALIAQVPGVPMPGTWKLEVHLQKDGKEIVGTSSPFTVMDPPGVPKWVGWVVGLVPFYGLIGFAGFEWVRTRRAIAADGGARA